MCYTKYCSSVWHSWSWEWHLPTGTLCSCRGDGAFRRNTGGWGTNPLADRVRPGTPPLLGTGQFRRRRRRSPIWMLPCFGDGSRAGSTGSLRGMCPLWSWGRMCCSASGPGPASWSCAPCLNDGYIYVIGWFFVWNQWIVVVDCIVHGRILTLIGRWGGGRGGVLEIPWKVMS